MARIVPVNRASLIAGLRRIASKLGKARVTRDEFVREAGITRDTMLRHFGSFEELVEAAKLRRGHDTRRLDDEALLRSVREAILAKGPLIGLRGLARFTGRGEMTLRSRWGSWRGVVAAFVAWAEREEPRFPHLEALRLHYKLPPTSGLATPERRLGGLLRFRALEFAPTTEGGVIYLFGMVADELGFLVDGISKEFPDAEGKRRVGREWRRVRIEFELDSRGFQRHGHDPAGCDLIICWEHNWPDCPVEVLELKSALPRLPEAAPGIRYARLASCGDAAPRPGIPGHPRAGRGARSGRIPAAG